ncbi:TetR/AcrR family transcriptional regulator [Microbacterium laevaniformans]|uniref:TetR/AcrR family transcriptional regulator n=1 Tax=Microbacterium laevaniformans TaxID=36807 RepID=A0A4S2CYQ4_9MICO|nr:MULTISPECIES: TetR/AcrR family transcriptional regulator [Microbacterium]AXA95192.1 TetR/AcrR family transcriptional regulator [Microbacterium sp. PM5]MDC7805172.1 TetR/AcrR family transcriptional regulator [Sphingomonas sp. BLCC-B65]TGY33722.1 TetR/AcrR family transcriptional regulator [Microbacterium laevaniformans]
MPVDKRQTRNRPETLTRRREILDAAVEIFGSKGFASGTLGDIAEQVGMTHAGILHHFGSKDQLLLEVLKHRDASDVAHLDDQHIPDGMPLFRHLVRTAFLNAQRAGIVQAYAVLSAESVTDDHPGREFFERRYRTLRAEVAHAFAVVCAERGVTAPHRIADASAAILAVMDGLQVQWLLEPDALDLGTASEFAIEAIVAAVLDPRPSPLA